MYAMALHSSENPPWMSIRALSITCFARMTISTGLSERAVRRDRPTGLLFDNRSEDKEAGMRRTYVRLARRRLTARQLAYAWREYASGLVWVRACLTARGS